MLSGEQKETYNKAVIAVLEGKSASDAAVIDDIAGRDIVFHYFCASEYTKIAKYIADRQILSDNRRVRQAFEVLLYLIGHCPANKKEKRFECIVRILDFTNGLSREQKFRLLLAYTIQLRNMIRPNVSISDSKAFIDKMIRYALELHDSANGLTDHVVIMDAFIIAAMFYTDEDFQEEAKWAFEKFEEIELTYADLLKYFSFTNAEVVSLAFRDQISLANKELFFYITAGDLKKADAVLRNIRSKLRFVRLHNLLFSSKAVLLAWALYEKSLFFLSEKLGVENSRPDALTSVVTAYKILFLYDREWFCTAAVETLYREFDLLTAKNSISKLPGIYKRIGRVRSRENKLYSKFEHMLERGNLEEKLRNPEISDPEHVQSANANLSMIEEIKTFHQRLESDEGVIEEALFLHEAGQSPEAVLQRYLPFVEWSEKQYKKHGGSLYAGNYARRLEKAADAYFNMEEYQESIDWYVKAIEVYETLLKHERYKDYEAFARCGENIGRAALSLDTEAYDEYAETAFDEVLSIRQGMAEMFPEADMENDLAVAFYNLALAQRRNEKYDLSYANFQTAADTGFAAAVNYMGIAFEYGEGVARDLDKAREYYRQACELGDESGKINLDRLEKESV
jgi:TPR repeat protein